LYLFIYFQVFDPINTILLTFMYKKLKKNENEKCQLGNSQYILKILSNIGIYKIKIRYKFQESAFIRF